MKNIQIIAPSRSFSKVPQWIRFGCEQTLQKKLTPRIKTVITYGNYVADCDSLDSASIKKRVDDLSEAFINPNVDIILAATGGYTANDLLPSINWNAIQKNPKPFCGFSDITVLLNAIYAKTNIRTYYTPNAAIFARPKGITETLQSFVNCVIKKQKQAVIPSSWYSDSNWKTSPKKIKKNTSSGYWIIQKGKSKGTIIGGNLCSLNLLQGTQYLPKRNNLVLFLEEDDLAKENTLGEFSRNIRSLLQCIGVNNIRAIMIGRFQNASLITQTDINQLFNRMALPSKIPIIANIDFGHTFPMISFPIGGTATINTNTKTMITIQ